MNKTKLAAAPVGKGKGRKFVVFTYIEASLRHQFKGEGWKVSDIKDAARGYWPDEKNNSW